jgi:hypothetical protein
LIVVACSAAFNAYYDSNGIEHVSVSKKMHTCSNAVEISAKKKMRSNRSNNIESTSSNSNELFNNNNSNINIDNNPIYNIFDVENKARVIGNESLILSNYSDLNKGIIEFEQEEFLNRIVNQKDVDIINKTQKNIAVEASLRNIDRTLDGHVIGDEQGFPKPLKTTKG